MTWKTLAMVGAVAMVGCGETTTRSDSGTMDDAGTDARAASTDAHVTGDDARVTGDDAAVVDDAAVLVELDAPALLDTSMTRPDAAVFDAGSMTSDAGSDAGALDGGASGPLSVTYVIGAISLPTGASPTRVAPGFNIDALNSGTGGGVGCVASNPDYVSLTGEVGVDNLFVGSVAGSLMSFGGINVQNTLNDQIASGALLLAMRVSGIDSFVDDSAVTLDVFLVKQASCAGATCPVVGGVMAGQPWRQRAVAYATGAPGTITSGNLRSAIAVLPFDIGTLHFDIQSASIGAAISPTSLRTGQVGGTIPFTQVVSAAMLIMPGINESLVRSIVHPDLTPRAGAPDTCDGVSIGFGFTAVPAATISPL